MGLDRVLRLSTPPADQSAVRSFADKAAGYGIPGVTVDGFNGRPLVMVSTKGGMNIEEVARQNPANISSLRVRVDRGLFTFEA